MNPIYRFGVLVGLLAATLTGTAQSKSYRIYDEYSGRDGFTFLAFSKSMIDAVNLNIDEENKKITGDLMEVRILISNHEKNMGEETLTGKFSEKFNHLNYRKVEPKGCDKDDNVEFWVDGDSKKVKECHVIVKNSEDNQFSCLVSFYGNFKVEDLESLGKFSRKQAEKKD
jgi:hypothetical protein